MDQKANKLMTMHEVLHLREYKDRLYVSRKDGGRGLATIEECVDASVQGLEDYIKRRKEWIITFAKAAAYVKIEKTHKLGSRAEKKNAVWIFLATNRIYCARKTVGMATQGEPQERNWIFSNICIKRLKSNSVKAKSTDYSGRIGINKLYNKRMQKISAE